MRWIWWRGGSEVEPWVIGIVFIVEVGYENVTQSMSHNRENVL
jgi:hypothetical protein